MCVFFVCAVFHSVIYIFKWHENESPQNYALCKRALRCLLQWTQLWVFVCGKPVRDHSSSWLVGVSARMVVGSGRGWYKLLLQMRNWCLLWWDKKTYKRDSPDLLSVLALLSAPPPLWYLGYPEDDSSTCQSTSRRSEVDASELHLDEMISVDG